MKSARSVRSREIDVLVLVVTDIPFPSFCVSSFGVTLLALVTGCFVKKCSSKVRHFVSDMLDSWTKEFQMLEEKKLSTLVGKF